jgi:hypothetical protein
MTAATISSTAAPSAIACASRSMVATGSLPQVARAGLCEEEAGITRRQHRSDRQRPHENRQDGSESRRPRRQPHRRQGALRGEEIGAPYQPRLPVRPDQDVVEALRPLEIDDQDHGRRDQEHERDGGPRSERQRHAIAGDERQQQADEHRSGGDAFRQQVYRHVEAPRLDVGRVVIDARVARFRRGRRRRAERSQQHLAFLVDERADRELRLDRDRFGAEVEHLGNRVLLRFAYVDTIQVRDPRDFTRRIVEIAEDAALGRADADARRQQLVLDAVRAEVAFLGGARARIDEQLIVGARRHAGAAADARVAKQIDNPVAALEQRVGRTDPHARRVVALIAEDGEEEALGARKRALLDGLDPAPVHADRNLMFGLAGDRARVAADALAQIDRETVIGHAGQDYSTRVESVRLPPFTDFVVV